MAVVSVTPEEFTIVLFQADDIAALADKIATKIGFPADTPISVRIDEPNLFQRVRLTSMSPITLDIEGAAFEDPKRFRQFSANLAENTLARLLFQDHDINLVLVVFVLKILPKRNGHEDFIGQNFLFGTACYFNFFNKWFFHGCLLGVTHEYTREN